MKIIVITAAKSVEGESRIINALFEHGLELLHLRKPGCSTKQMSKMILTIDKSYWNRIIIHEHITLYDDFNLAGIHIKPSLFKRMSSDYGILSTSSHRISDFCLLDSLNSQIFLSPMFDSISKPGYFGNQDLLSAGKTKRKGKLIALGGIGSNNIRTIANGGFDGAAVLGSIWQSHTPINHFNLIKKIARYEPST